MAARESRRGNLLFRITAEKVTEDMREGDSIAVNGVCLTVTGVERDAFQVEASVHTIEVSTLVNLKVGRRMNLERALKAGDRLGGHIVQGHVDGAGRVARVQYREGSTLIFLETSASIQKLLAPKGSVAIDGVSLTVVAKSQRGFEVMLVPYTLEHTSLGDLKPGDSVNIETDLIIRWLTDRFSEGEVGDSPMSGFLETGDFHLED